MQASNSQSEIKLWLTTCLKNENISNIVMDNMDALKAHEGYMGDIIFVDVNADKEGTTRNYNIALKIGKDSEAVRETTPAKAMFHNEIYFYENILPVFSKFQKERGIDRPFDSTPRYYGTFYSDQREVMAFENLQSRGYSLWDRKKPMTRSHIGLVVREYAKFHAISLAMNDQNPQQFQAVTEPLKKLLESFTACGTLMTEQFIGAINEVSDILQDHLDAAILSKWKNFSRALGPIFQDMVLKYDGIKVVSHGDCWNNNFMFQVKDNDKRQPIGVAILDWQIAKLVPPVSDLAHFLFTSISEEDINDFSQILDEYYDTLADYLVKLKSDPEIYTKEKFLENWKQFSRLGIMLTSLSVKIATADSEEIVDLTEAAESGNFSEAFHVDVKDPTLLRDRMKHVVKYVVENGLVEV